MLAEAEASGHGGRARVAKPLVELAVHPDMVACRVCQDDEYTQEAGQQRGQALWLLVVIVHIWKERLIQ